MTAYNLLLKDPLWQKKRLEIFNRDNWQCTKCTDSFSTLHIHHLYYIFDANPWEYPGDALVTVCELCHDKYEFLKKLDRFLLLCLRPDFLERDITEIQTVIHRKVWENHHGESVRRYMEDIKLLCNG